MLISPKPKPYRLRSTRGLALMSDVIAYVRHLSQHLGTFRIDSAEITASSASEFGGSVDITRTTDRPGPVGPTGPDGYPGFTGVGGGDFFGPPGAAGEAGPTGTLPGDKGVVGATGIVGEDGGAGPIGADGPIGPLTPGPTGYPGPNSGALGPDGPTGPTGADGIENPGAPGPPGPARDVYLTYSPLGSSPDGPPGPAGAKLAIIEIPAHSIVVPPSAGPTSSFVVPASAGPASQFVAFHVAESPRCLWLDHLHAVLPAHRTTLEIPIDPLWIECLDSAESIEILSLHIPGGAVTAELRDSSRIILRATSATRHSRPAVITVGGIARAHNGRRFPQFTAAQAARNAAFWSSSLNR